MLRRARDRDGHPVLHEPRVCAPVHQGDAVGLAHATWLDLQRFLPCLLLLNNATASCFIRSGSWYTCTAVPITITYWYHGYRYDYLYVYLDASINVVIP